MARSSVMKLVYALVIAVALIFGGAVFFRYYENWDWLDSFYFAVTTLSTVGYGDLQPTRPETKLFVIFYVLFGVAMMFYAFNALAQYWVGKREPDFHKRLDSLAHFSHRPDAKPALAKAAAKPVPKIAGKQPAAYSTPIFTLNNF